MYGPFTTPQKSDRRCWLELQSILAFDRRTCDADNWMWSLNDSILQIKLTTEVVCWANQ